MKEKRSMLFTLLKLLPLAVMLAAALYVYLTTETLTVESLLARMPSTPQGQAAFLLGAYVFKSLTMVFPLLALYLAGGLLFSPGVAILLNIVGVCLSVGLPYVVGRISGRDLTRRLLERYPKLRKVDDLQQNGTFLFSVIMRVVGFVPLDVGSLYMGAMGVPFLPYLLGSLLGLLPGLVTTTILGASASDPTSPAFYLSAGGLVLISVGSILGYRLYLRKKQ